MTGATNTCGPATIKVAGASVPYRVCGRGKPLLLIHGLAGSSRWWRRNIDALAEQHRTYTVDLPGFGALRGLGRSFRVAAAAGWIISLADALAVERLALIGHSMGALIALGVAARAPERVRRLVLVSPAIGLTNKTVVSNLLPLLNSGRSLEPAFLPTLVHDSLRAGPFTVWRVAREMLAVDADEQLQRLCTPALVVHGERDHLVPLPGVRLLCERIRGATLHMVPGAGHVPMFERPHEFNAAVLRFLADEEAHS